MRPWQGIPSLRFLVEARRDMCGNEVCEKERNERYVPAGAAGVALTKGLVGGTRCDAVRQAMGGVLVVARDELSITCGWGWKPSVSC